MSIFRFILSNSNILIFYMFYFILLNSKPWLCKYSIICGSAFTVSSFFVSDLELEESDPPQADNDNAIDDASNNATIFFFICFSFHFICFKMFRLLLFSRVYLFNQISPPYKYFRIKRAVYLWLEILDELHISLYNFY